ncbi:hypothetical protein ACIBCP_15850 [Streptomyces sp. NPDC051287]|uniref:hypothetical protein n=1 Tax=Streptomyces sp. NPDC051287 TaxID=3365648 RepID=UPI00379021E6
MVLDQPCGGFVDGVGGTPYGGDGRFELRNVCTAVERLDCLVEVAAGPAEPTSAVEQGCDDFAFVGDLGAGAVEVAGGGESGAGEEPGDGQTALGGGGFDQGELIIIETCVGLVDALLIGRLARTLAGARSVLSAYTRLSLLLILSRLRSAPGRSLLDLRPPV